MSRSSRLNDTQYKGALEKMASGNGLFSGILARAEGVQRGDWQEYNKSVSEAGRGSIGQNLKNFANWQLNRMNTASSMGESKQPATEDIQTRRDNFRKSLFKTLSGGNVNTGAVRRKSLLGE